MPKSRRVDGLKERRAPAFAAKPGYDRAQTMKVLKTMPDKDIDFSDIPELDEEWFAKAELRAPLAKTAVSIRLDPDVLAFFRKQGKGYQTRINAVLRAYMKGAKDKA